MTKTLNYEPGSYRDRDGRVFYAASGRVCRALSARALTEWHAVERTQFFTKAIADGRVIATRQLTEPELGESSTLEWAGVLEHQAVPCITYPFEWSFGMLQDAALLHLELINDALDEDLTLKDGTAYNVQWVNNRPVFIDVASFERLRPGQPWAGYRQFCQTFLYPLLLQAYKNIPFQPWLRGRLDGITPQECRSLMSLRDFFRRGVASHVWLHAWLGSQRSVDEVDASKALKTAGFSKELIRANIQGLLKLVKRLRWSPGRSTWSDYPESNSYTVTDRDRKERFVRQAIHSRAWKRVWDVGCNTGIYSRIAAENAELVVAMDADHPTVERMYQSLKKDPVRGPGSILPLVNNIVDFPVGLGWRGTERTSLVERGRPELCLCLAVVHHLVIGHGVPLRELLAWFAEMGTSLVIEFVSKSDPMVKRLLRGRHDGYADYEQPVFEKTLSELFSIRRTESLDSGTRVLYFAERRSLS
jgi:ribosomal protein L11 methylase PrmA